MCFLRFRRRKIVEDAQTTDRSFATVLLHELLHLFVVGNDVVDAVHSAHFMSDGEFFSTETAKVVNEHYNFGTFQMGAKRGRSDKLLHGILNEKTVVSLHAKQNEEASHEFRKKMSDARVTRCVGSDIPITHFFNDFVDVLLGLI